MTDADARLERALAAASPHPVDPAFVLEVMRRAEDERYQAMRLAALLRGAALAGAASALTFPAAGWVAQNLDAVLLGGAATAVLFSLLGVTRALGRRAVSKAAL